MFVNTVYQNRRRILKHRVDQGVIWLQGNQEVGMNYPGNPYPFRQDSNMLYYTGIEKPNTHLIIDIDEDEEYLIGDDLTPDETIWIGDLPRMEVHAEEAGISNTLPNEELGNILKKAVLSGRTVHTLPTYHGYQKENILQLTGNAQEPSEDLIRAIVDQRSKKENREIIEIENALGTTAEVHRLVLEESMAGRSEQEIYAKAVQVVLRNGGRLAYNAIVTVMGQILHINTYDNHLKEGQMLLCDMGAENAMHYASDITRTFPVNRKFTSQQKDIYEIVLRTLDNSIERLRPGIQFKDVHLQAAKDITQGLIDLGLMRGNVDDIVEAGAHALFFPHGLGHMLGLDVHDMEGLGETYVGYNSVTRRSEQFGTSNLRLGRILEEDFVITVEPGLYFIPNLIEIWKGEQKYQEFIRYDRLNSWMNFGGVRIEDNVVITDKASKILGPPIPRSIEEIESV